MPNRKKRTLTAIDGSFAATVLRHPVVGPNWMAVGDAAFAVDPLFRQAIYRSIESGLRSAAALARDTSGMAEYESCTDESFRSYLAARNQFYGAVERWPGSLFWQSRPVR